MIEGKVLLSKVYPVAQMDFSALLLKVMSVESQYVPGGYDYD
jgi:hypothetical protein